MKMLRDLREKTGRLQIDIAKELGIDHSTLSGYELGIRTPSPEMLAKMADVYGVEYSEIFAAYLETRKQGGRADEH